MNAALSFGPRNELIGRIAADPGVVPAGFVKTDVLVIEPGINRAFLALTGLGIAVTQLVALLGGQAASLIAGGLRSRPKTAKAPAKAKPQGPGDGGTKRPAPSNVVRLDAARHSVKSWLDKATVRGGEALKPISAMRAGWRRI